MDPVINRDAVKQIPVARPALGPAEAEAVKAAVESGWISQGPAVTEFENSFAEAHNRQYGITCNSGTTALHLALAALNVKPGDQVVIPTLTMIAVANAVLYCGGIPVFVDSEPTTGNIDLSILPQVRSGTAVIIPHLYGVPAPLDQYKDEIHRLEVIEDCAEAHYARFNTGEAVGSLGRLATFSFYANKIVVAGEGGIVLTDEADIDFRLRQLRAHAFTPGNHFHHKEPAFGYRMTELQAAVARVQHARRLELLAARERVANKYMERLQDIPWLEFPARSPYSVWWVFPVLTCKDSGLTAADIRRVLADNGIETRTYFNPLHRQPFLQKYASTQRFPVADDLYRRGLYLPLFPNLEDADVDYICNTVRTCRS